MKSFRKLSEQGRKRDELRGKESRFMTHAEDRK